MDYFRNRLWKGGRDDGAANQPNGVKINIFPGQVEEAIHAMPFTGAIDISGLNFYAYPHEDDVEFANLAAADGTISQSGNIDRVNYDGNSNVEADSVVDIAIFQLANDKCATKKCDTSEFGVGKLEQIDGMPYMNLCENGRLKINNDVFTGLHVELAVPAHGRLPERHIANEDGILPVLESNRRKNDERLRE